uniref:SAM_MT_RSMB_NOP domain-containing protein n=1 Tax=Echinostoma caproni TaxID=27848 RepID=A0A183A0P7_9TREM
LSVHGPTPVELNPIATKTSNQPRVEALCSDFLSLDPLDPKFSRVKSILLDPSCSGSGLRARQPDGSTGAPLTSGKIAKCDEHSDTASYQDGLLWSEQSEKRLQRLANLQAQLLNHALKFPNVERVVYSTCSLCPKENEQVVSEVLATSRGRFVLEPIWMNNPGLTTQISQFDWKTRGLSEYDCEPCLRTVPEKDLANGFFVACFRRELGVQNRKRTHADRSRASVAAKRACKEVRTNAVWKTLLSKKQKKHKRK